MFKVKCKSCENRLEETAVGIHCDECLWHSGNSELDKANREIVRLRGLVEKAWASGWISRSYRPAGPMINIAGWHDLCHKFLSDNNVEPMETK